MASNVVAYAEKDGALDSKFIKRRVQTHPSTLDLQSVEHVLLGRVPKLPRGLQRVQLAFVFIDETQHRFEGHRRYIRYLDIQGDQITFTI